MAFPWVQTYHLPPGAQSSPVFVASAIRDPRDGGNLLQRIQIIKGWIDRDGRTHQAVYDLAGNEQGDASVDPQAALYPAADLPNCVPAGKTRISTRRRRPSTTPGCWKTPAAAGATTTASPSPRSCARPVAATRELPWQIQERAWTSPIWYRPQQS